MFHENYCLRNMSSSKVPSAYGTNHMILWILVVKHHELINFKAKQRFHITFSYLLSNLLLCLPGVSAIHKSLSDNGTKPVICLTTMNNNNNKSSN